MSAQFLFAELSTKVTALGEIDRVFLIGGIARWIGALGDIDHFLDHVGGAPGKHWRLVPGRLEDCDELAKPQARKRFIGVGGIRDVFFYHGSPDLLRILAAPFLFVL